MFFEVAFFTAAYVGLVYAQPDNLQAGIEPTKSGQIGVNPVSIYPEESYHLPHAHTQYWNQKPSTTQWIGVNTEMLTELPYVTTVDNKPTVTTAAANIVASIIASPTDGAVVGDVAVTFSQKLSNILNEIAAEVEATPCARQKRAACAARVASFAQRVAEELEPGGRLAFIQDFPTITVTAPDVAAVVGFIANVRVRAIASLAVASYLISKVPAKLPTVFKLMKDMVIVGGTGTDVESCPPFELKCDGCKGNLLGICVFPWAGCPCTKTEDCPELFPRCEDEKCKGDSDNFCTNEHKGCMCEPEENEGECPELPEDWPECKDCNGDIDQLVCKEEYDGAKDCECTYFPQVGAKPLLDTVDLVAAREVMKDFQPMPARPEEPANHGCNTPGNFWFTKDQGLKIVSDFCDKNANQGDGDDWLRYRKPGTTDDMSNAIVSSYPVDGTDNTIVRIYAFIDETVTCRKLYPDGMHMNRQNCIDGLSFLVNKCQEGQDDKKFGGQANIRCHSFNLAPLEKTFKPKEPNSVPSVCCDGVSDNSCC